MKPNPARKASPRQPDSSVLVNEIAAVAVTIRQAQAKYDNRAGSNGSASSKGQRLLVIHPCGDVFCGGPMALAKATPKQVGSTVMCDLLRVALESVTAAAAGSWQRPRQRW